MDNIEQKIFHGINLGNNCNYVGELEDIDIFADILKERKILTREELYKSKSKILHHLKNYHGQRLDELCLAMHPKTKCFYDDEPLEDAFYEFIRFRLSFIFDYSILDTRKYDLAFGMPGEIRLYNSLELDNNLVGIGFFDEIDYIINKINRHKATKYNPFYHNLKYCDDVMEYVDERKEKLYVIKDMIKKQGFDVPIVDPFSGRVINDDRDKDIDNVNKTD